MNENSFAVLSGTSHPQLAEALARQLQIPLLDREIQYHPDGEIDVHLLDQVENRQILIVQSLAYKPNDYLMELCILADTVKRNRAQSIVAVIPYLCYGRQDHSHDNGGSLTSKIVVNFLEMSGIDEVILVAPHSERIPSFFSIPVTLVPYESLFAESIASLNWDDLTIVSPDRGRIRSVQQIAHILNCDTAFINKRRLQNNQLEGELIGDLVDRNVVIVDDICCTGTTLCHAIKICQQAGVQKIAVKICHPIFSRQFDEKFSSYQKQINSFFVTNTVPNSTHSLHLQLQVIDITSAIVQALWSKYPEMSIYK
ncbi:MAG: prs [Chlamydiales bacterium]|nr:prs [Chlamydiales bacterium]